MSRAVGIPVVHDGEDVKTERHQLAGAGGEESAHTHRAPDSESP